MPHVTHRPSLRHRPRHARARERRWARRLVVAVALALPLHWALGQWVMLRDLEPWPLISLPGFGSTSAPQRLVVHRPVVQFRDDHCSEAELDVAELLHDIPHPLQQGLMRAHFRRDSARSPQPASQAWLLQRTRQVVGRDLSFVALRWDRIELDGRGQQTTQQPVQTWVLAEGDCGQGSG